MEKILLAAINARYVHSNPAVFYLEKTVSSPGREVKIISSFINSDPAELLSRFAAEDPDAIGISVYIWNSAAVKRIIPMIKKNLPYALIFLGGPEAGYNADRWKIEFPYISHIIRGPGETAFKKLAENEFSGLPFLIEETPPHFNDIPFPYCPADYETLKDKIIYYESSRGCPYNCSYCLSSADSAGIQYRDIDKVKGELDFLAAWKPRIIKFVDRSFNSSAPRSREIWEYLIARHASAGVRFHFEIYPQKLQKEDFELFGSCPDSLFQFEIGIQSTNRDALKAVRRNSEAGKALKAAERIISGGNIHVHLDLIAGLPFEDIISFEKSFNTIYSLNPDHFQCGILKILPGTPLSDEAVNLGIKHNPAPPYEIISGRWLDEAQIKTIKKTARLIDVLRNAGRFKTSLDFLLKKTGSPFRLFSGLAADFDSSVNSPVYSAGKLLALVKTSWPEDLDYFKDCLNWDFFRYSKQHRLPPELREPLSDLARKKGFQHFITMSQNGVIRYEGVSFDMHELKKSSFFIPGTEKFKNEFLNSGNAAMALPDKTIFYFSFKGETRI